MPCNSDPNYCFDGSPQAEWRITTDQLKIAKAVRQVIPGSELVAMVLIGGYGRGEGGYVLDLNDVAAPYNDYDYFLIFQGVSRRHAQELCDAVPDLTDLVGVEVDFAPLRREELPRLRPSLMLAEMAWGGLPASYW